MKALIIGGTKGFGKELTQLLVNQKWDVITVGRSEPMNTATNHFTCDIGNLTQWKETLRKITTQNKTLDLVVFVAGFARAKEAQDLTPDDWDEHLRKNVTYVALGLEALKPLLNNSAQPTVVTIGSQWSYKIGAPELVPYTVAKHALDTLTKDFAVRNKNVQINHYCVPTMDTPQYRKVQKSFASIGRTFAVKNLVDPKQVAESILQNLKVHKESGETILINTNYFACTPLSSNFVSL